MKRPKSQDQSKKVRVFAAQTFETPNRYSKNRLLLAFIPGAFVFGIVITLTAFGLWYFGVFDSIASSGSQPERVEGVNEVQPVATELSPIPESLPPIETATSRTISPPPDSININQNGEKNCTLTYNLQPPATLNPILQSEKQGWWIPISCHENSIIAIQIFRTNDVQALEIGKINKLGKNLQKIDTVDTYALIYTQNNVESGYRLDSFVKILSSKVFDDRFYFNTVSAHAELRLGSKTYYLDGNCQNGGSEPCKLWEWDNFSGSVVLKKRNIADTGQGQANELKPGLTLNFAKQQDYENGINLILYNTKRDFVRLIRISFETDTPSVITTLDMTPSHPSYQLYV